MRITQSIMGMPITIEIVGTQGTDIITSTFNYFREIDERFSTYKETSEIMKINRGEITDSSRSDEMREVYALAEKTKSETAGYFDIVRPDGIIDPSGIVKGWAIQKAAEQIRAAGYKDFYVEAGGDIQSNGHNADGREWSVGIKNPFDQKSIVKVVYPHGKGVATSGTYIRGQHIYNPHTPEKKLTNVISLTVIGPDVCEADRFATAAFAMEEDGIRFIESLDGFEGYSIDTKGIATMTGGFERYTE